MVIFALGRDETAVHPLLLEAQHHDDIDVLQALFHVFIDLDAEVAERRKELIEEFQLEEDAEATTSTDEKFNSSQ